MGGKQDLAGQTFGLWTVLTAAPPDASGRRRWRCRCACGKERDVLGYALTHGITRSCGHTSGERQRADLTGRTFGKLQVLDRCGYAQRAHQTIWRCRCACGRETEVAAGNLLSGHTTSCGCALSAAQQSTVARVEGLQNSPRTGGFETNIRAKSWILTDGRRVYAIRNLSKFVREHAELLGIGPDPVSIKRALRGLFDAAQKKYKWFGWSISQVDDDTR